LRGRAAPSLASLCVFTCGVRRHPGSAGVPPARAWMRARCPRSPEKCEHVRPPSQVESFWERNPRVPHTPPTYPLPCQGSGADRTYGRRRAVWRWGALVGPHSLPRSSFAGEPALSLSKRGDQSRARGRSNAVHATLARMFCPPLNCPAERPNGRNPPRLPGL